MGNQKCRGCPEDRVVIKIKYKKVQQEKEQTHKEKIRMAENQKIDLNTLPKGLTKEEFTALPNFKKIRSFFT